MPFSEALSFVETNSHALEVLEPIGTPLILALLMLYFKCDERQFGPPIISRFLVGGVREGE